jgi:hypothetical protein
MLHSTKCFSLVVSLLFCLAAGACGGSDPTGSGGEGTLSFTTWGEEYIEREIPPDPGDGSGFSDGWTVTYQKFLVNFQNIEVADASGTVAAKMAGSLLVNNKLAGVKPLIDFEHIAAKAWGVVSYEIAPTTDESDVASGVTAADKQLMVDGGFSVYVAAVATKGELVKHYAWGFAIGTRYKDCHSQQDGKDETGVVVTNNSTVEVQLTTHGDHLYYDRLQASPDPAVKTSLRFDALAAADEDDDGEVTLEELTAAPLDVRLYDPSGFEASSQGAFVTSLARTIGHFRGEGECNISKL